MRKPLEVVLKSPFEAALIGVCNFLRRGSCRDDAKPFERFLLEVLVGLLKYDFPPDIDDRVVVGGLSRNSFSSNSTANSLDGVDVNPGASLSKFPPEVLVGLLKNGLRPDIDDRVDKGGLSRNLLLGSD
jgi:hypothetical protein